MTHGTLTAFGTVLHAFRMRIGVTQQQLADHLGVRRNTIGHWERGNVLPQSKGIVLELAKHLHLDDFETRQLLEASLTALAPHWSVPYPRNPYFTGRADLLDTLPAQLGAEQAVALYGLGGVGKTQVALEYAYRYALDYRAVFWIAAETAESITSSLLSIAETLHLPERADTDQHRIIAAVQRWFTTHGDWLLIWDNVEDLNLLVRWLPVARSGAILLTTRLQMLGMLARGIAVTPMDSPDGMLFLLRRAHLLEPDATHEQVRQFAERMPAHFTAAQELLTLLGDLPLALDQAGAYLEATHCGLPAYRDLFHARRAVLLQQRGSGPHLHPASVTTTFRLSLIATARQHPAVRDLLSVCALLQPEAIPEDLFVGGRAHLGAALADVCGDAVAWNALIAAASSASLLQRQPGEQTLSLHRLVQAVLLDGMSEQECLLWVRRVGIALAAIFPDVTPQVWGQCERLLPHVVALAAHLPEAAGTREMAQVVRKAADYLRDRAQYEQAESLYQRALCLLEPAPEDAELAVVLNNLAVLYFARGYYERAEPLYQRAVGILEQAKGPEHPDVASPVVNLALICKVQGQYKQAERLYQRALQIQELALGPEHPNLANTLYNLAVLYYEQGQYERAEPFYQRALRILEQALGPEHPHLAYPLDGLADLYQKQGEAAQAKLLYQRALQLREQTAGREHPVIAYTLDGLASLALEQRQHAEAESYLQRALVIRERHLGPDHSETARTLYDLAILRRQQGHMVEARALAERALTIRRQSLGVDHPTTGETQLLYEQVLVEQAVVQDHGAATRSALGAERHTPGCEEYPPETGSIPAAEDSLLQGFLEACCERHPHAWCRSVDLWRAYQRWTEEHQERYPLSRRALGVQVKMLGCRADRTKVARIWRGITLVHSKGDAR
jgi:tetratricopeptide (TPR) repeat protein